MFPESSTHLGSVVGGSAEDLRKICNAECGLEGSSSADGDREAMLVIIKVAVTTMVLRYQHCLMFILKVNLIHGRYEESPCSE